MAAPRPPRPVAAAALRAPGGASDRKPERESCPPKSLARTRRPAGPTPGRAETSAGTRRESRCAATRTPAAYPACAGSRGAAASADSPGPKPGRPARSEEHTSELQSQSNLVCRLLLEKKKKAIDDTGQKIPIVVAGPSHYRSATR